MDDLTLDTSIAQLKSRLRKEALARRDSLSPAEIESKSEKIKERLFSLPDFRESGGIMLYASMRSEVRTRNMIEEALDLGKRVAVPVTRFRPKWLEPSWIRGWDELVPSKFGVPEPPDELFQPVPLEEIELVVVPGLAFDLNGYRLGYGAGFYDRFLAQLIESWNSKSKAINPGEETGDGMAGRAARPAFIAVAYELQIVDELPRGELDVPVDAIVTEDRLIKVTDQQKATGQGVG